MCASAAPLPSAQGEIDHLFGYVAVSHCAFQRNGNWYDAQRALAHLRSKYEFVKSSIDTAEEFIEKAATRSSLSGRPYEVSCGAAAPVSSAQWLRVELYRYRAVHGPSLR